MFGVFGMPNHAASDTYVRACDQIVGAVPILLPANGSAADISTLIQRLDGLILTGSRSNVQPSLYDGPPHLVGTPEDEMRDGVTLPLVRAAVSNGLPLLAICRGLQEMNVALGGSLHQRVQDLPGRMDHSTPMQANPRVRTGKAHAVRVTQGGWLHNLTHLLEIPVNSLHNQAIDRLAPGLVIEATAPDGTIEAVRAITTLEGRPAGYAIGVQWHPEYDFHEDAISHRIFEDFAAAVHRTQRGAKWSASADLAAAAD